MSARRAFVWSLSGQFFSLAAMLMAMIVLARLLAPREMGIFAIGVAFTGILQIISAFGLSTYVTREHELTPPKLATAFTINTVLAILLAIATYGLSFAGAASFDDPGVAQVLRLLAFVPLIGVFEFLPAAILQRNLQFKPISVVLTVRSLGSTLVTIAAALLGESYLSAAYGGLIYAAIGAVGVNIALPGHLATRFGFKGWRTIALFGLQVMSIGGFSVLSMRLAEIVMGRMLGLPALGIYTRASTIYTAIYVNVFGAAARVLLAQLATDMRRTGSLRDTYLYGMQIALGFMWPILAGVAVLSQPIVYRLFGEQWSAAAVPLSILMASQFVAMSFAMSYELFVLRDELGRQTRYELFRSMFGLVLFSAACMHSMEAAAASRVIEALLAAAIYLPHLTRMAGTRGAEMLRMFGQNAVLAAITVAPCAAMMIAGNWRADIPVLLLMGAVASGGVLWLGALRVLGHPLFDEIARGARRFASLWTSHRHQA